MQTVHSWPLNAYSSTASLMVCMANLLLGVGGRLNMQA